MGIGITIFTAAAAKLVADSIATHTPTLLRRFARIFKSRTWTSKSGGTLLLSCASTSLG